MALNLAGRDDQAVRVIGAAGHVQNDDILGLVVFQAFLRGFNKKLQPVGRQFFAAPAACGARRCGRCGSSRFGGALCLGRWFRGGGFCSGALRRWLGGSGFRRGLGGRLWRRLRRSRFGGSRFRRGFRLWQGSSLRLGAGLGRGFGFRLRGGAPF
ncbi:MAG: hypothetical protein O9313_14330 [Acetobacteraceae bacterium]|nr:hypothetical protein [Acetobacteraceae bacterium]